MTTPIFYNPRQSIPDVASYSKSAGKAARFVQLMQHLDYRSYGGDKLGDVLPIDTADLKLVHDYNYVDAVFAGVEMNGFENYDSRVPKACLWAIGSLLAASKHAMRYPVTPACSPTSGFHHARFSEGGGYCTFNGLMVVAVMLIEDNPKLKIAILDLDMHAGDGTIDILNHHPGYAKKILHHSNGEHWFGEEDPDEWFIWLQECIDSINAFKPDLVLYQAGADMHINDPLGGILNNNQLAQRDRSVFRKILAPIAWNLAGGYQPAREGDIFRDPVLAIHRNTLNESNASVSARQANQQKAKDDDRPRSQN